jgi:hypothetical protein
MKIQEGLQTLKREQFLKRSPKGRMLSDYAIQTLESVISDEKNYQNELARCLGCGFVNSILLFEDGCPNCHVIDIKADIKQGEI